MQMDEWILKKYRKYAKANTYFQSSGAVGKTLPDLVVIMQPSISNPAI